MYEISQVGLGQGKTYLISSFTAISIILSGIWCPFIRYKIRNHLKACTSKCEICAKTMHLGILIQ